MARECPIPPGAQPVIRTVLRSSAIWLTIKEGNLFDVDVWLLYDLELAEATAGSRDPTLARPPL